MWEAGAASGVPPEGSSGRSSGRSSARSFGCIALVLRVVKREPRPGLPSTVPKNKTRARILMIPTIVGVAVVIVVLMRMLPGDVVKVRVTELRQDGKIDLTMRGVEQDGE